MKYYNWYSTSSNDYRPSDIDNECVALDPNLNYQWLDEQCNAQAYFICMRGTVRTYSLITRHSSDVFITLLFHKQLSQPFYHNTRSLPTHRPTDRTSDQRKGHETRVSIGIGRLHYYTAMWSTNNNKIIIMMII